jgi:hypothetical protein
VRESRTIEDIILEGDERGMSLLRPHLPQDFATDAAKFVLEHPGKVLILTGFYILSAGATETDGPPGAAVLGEALAALGYEVVFVTDIWSSEVIRALASPGRRVVEFPFTDHDSSTTDARQLIEEESPSLLIAVERAGLTGDRTYRNQRNIDISAYNAKLDYLVEQHPHSVGIGDGGNEIGMGLVAEAIRARREMTISPSVTKTSKLIVATCSNWGAYGLVAALSLLHRTRLLPAFDEIQRYIHLAVEAGAVDSASGLREPRVDGRALDEERTCIEELHELLKRSGC